MGYEQGVLAGQIFAVILTTTWTAIIWFKHTGTNQLLKAGIFTTLSFFASLGLGMIGGIPAIILSHWVCKSSVEPAALFGR